MALATDQVTKVRKLLAKAEAEGVTPAEAASLTAKAAELCARYGINKAMLARTDPGSDPRVNKVMTFPRPHAKARGYLYAKVLGAMRIRVILKDSYKAVHVFGFQSDMDLAEMMHASLTVQAQRGLAKAPIRPANYAGADVRSFYYRFAEEVAGRLRAVYAEQAAAAQTEIEAEGGPQQRGVVDVLGDRKTLVDADVDAVYGKLVKIRTSTSGIAGRAGAEAGRRADLGLNRVGADGGGRALAG